MDRAWYGFYRHQSRANTGVDGEWAAAFTNRACGLSLKSGDVIGSGTWDYQPVDVRACEDNANPPQVKIWHPDRPATTNPESVTEELYFAQSPLNSREGEKAFS